MKTSRLLFLFFLWSVNLSAQHKKISILFIGNSYTYVNNLPLLLDSMMTADGDTLEWDMSAPGGYTLQLHSTDTTTLSKINSRPWDYVVLQEQSQLPSLQPDSVDSTTIPFALLLDSLIHANNACTQTVFYETWGRKYGDSSNCAAYPPVCTYDGMQQRLMESYKLMADTCHAIVVPVGEAFRATIAFDSTVNLYQADYSHPSLEGSFLAASVFYTIINHESGSGNTYDPGVTQLPAYMFHLFANGTVEDSLNYWNLGINKPWAEFSLEQLPGCFFQFYSVSNSSFSHYWDFGDTTFSTDANPLHQYQHAHYWLVKHIVYDSCSSDTIMMALNVACGSGVNEYSQELFDIYPNPSSDILFIRPKPGYSQIKKISVYNEMGEKLFLNPSGSIDFVDISTLAEGFYFLQITDDQGHFLTCKITVAR